jgi:hypothetical protein
MANSKPVVLATAAAVPFPDAVERVCPPKLTTLLLPRDRDVAAT